MSDVTSTHVNLTEFILVNRISGRNYYPAVVHKPCNKAVATGNSNMKRVFDSMKSHECETENAPSSS